jgi:hypothetical protein
MAVVVLACASQNGAAQFAPVPTGNWGGRGIQLTVTDQGASVEYDCGHGSIDQPLAIDRSGRFSAAGMHVVERPGPQVEGGGDRQAARYQGEVDGDAMRISITLIGSQRDVGTFTLKRGVIGRLRKCL